MDPLHFSKEDASHEFRMPGFSAFEESWCKDGWCQLNKSVGREALQPPSSLPQPPPSQPLPLSSPLPLAVERQLEATLLTSGPIQVKGREDYLAGRQADELVAGGMFAGILLAVAAWLVHKRYTSARKRSEWPSASNLKQV